LNDVIGPIESYMTADHARLDALLRSAQADDGSVDARVYGEFRGGLLRHIAIEEKILLPLIRETGASVHNAEQIHADHARIARLLAGEPTSELLDRIREELATHNAIEEGDEGLYATSDAVAGDRVDAVIGGLRAIPAMTTARR
jgi:hypothetical protein